MDKTRVDQIIKEMETRINSGEFKIMSGEDHRYLTDTLTEGLHIALTKRSEIAEQFDKQVLNPPTQAANGQQIFDALPRLSIFIGQPDTGKTTEAIRIAEKCGAKSILKMCRDSLNLDTLLQDFELIDGKPNFKESIALKMLTGTENCIIIWDEFNTLLTGVMKTTQPIFDDTSKTFEYKGKVYNKNLNCKHIVTLNDKDKGISIIPDAILSRGKLRWFEPTPTTTIAKWTTKPQEWVNALYHIYKICGMLNIFGTRQIKILYGAPIKEIKNHLEGLCRMKNVDPKVITTPQMQPYLNKL